jgi:hypothetical protein
MGVMSACGGGLRPGGKGLHNLDCTGAVEGLDMLEWYCVWRRSFKTEAPTRPDQVLEKGQQRDSVWQPRPREPKASAARTRRGGPEPGFRAPRGAIPHGPLTGLRSLPPPPHASTFPDWGRLWTSGLGGLHPPPHPSSSLPSPSQPSVSPGIQLRPYRQGRGSEPRSEVAPGAGRAQGARWRGPCAQAERAAGCGFSLRPREDWGRRRRGSAPGDAKGGE